MIQSSDGGTYIESNLYMDTVMAQVSRDIAYLDMDPLELPDYKTLVKRKLGPFLVKVKTHYYNGYFHGLAGFERLDNCSAPYFFGPTAALESRLVLTNLKLKYNVRVSYGHFPSIYLSAKLKVSRLQMRLFVTTSPCRKFPILRSFEIEEMSEFRVIFEGLGRPLNSLLMQELKDNFLSHAKPLFFKVISKKFGNAIQRNVHKVLLPLPSTKIWVLR